jgi:hypothetical protein
MGFEGEVIFVANERSFACSGEVERGEQATEAPAEN